MNNKSNHSFRHRNWRMQTNKPTYGFPPRNIAVGLKSHPAENKSMITTKTWGEYLTTTEASEYLRRSVSWLLCQKDIPYLPGHPNSYKRTDLDAWYEKNKRIPLMG